MTDDPQNKISKPKASLSQEVGAKAARKLKARRNSAQGVWFGLGMMGLIGWSVVIPTLLGAALVPGILLYETESEGEVLVAVDEGVLIKTGPDVLVSVRRAIGGKHLDQLRDAVEQEFLTVDEHEQSVRSAMARLEIGVLRRFASLRHE